MFRTAAQRLCLAATLLAGSAGAATPVVEHAISGRLEPAEGTLAVRDTVTLPESLLAGGRATFTLHGGLDPEVETTGATLERLGAVRGAVPLERFRVTLPEGRRRFKLRYAGTIRHPLGEAVEGVGRRRSFTAGLIGEAGVFLGGASGWYPRFGGERVRFTLDVDLPEGWRAVSQGTDDGGRWREMQPQEGIYLVAGRYHRFRRTTPAGEALVFLREAEPALAERYLAATGRYLTLYGDLIGPYPYAKFALVENFWETGYGMPSFTLLGPRVVRLPFIVHTSYPHEILHNWWGNGVYVDYAGGNWAEGLTAYLADHLLRAERGGGAAYRRDNLQKYAEHAAGGDDFPLTAFRSRHGEASQAVGYGKAMMLFHMLRRRLGDAVFIAGLRRFYREQRFQYAGFDDLRRAFEAATGRDLKPFFEQWLTRTGAPALRLEEAIATAADAGGYRLRLTVAQTQAGAPYRLRLPLAVALEGRTEAAESVRTIDRRRQTVELDLPARPLRVALDPRFDLFRLLDPRELPPTLDALFGARGLLLVTPAGAPAEAGRAYRALARRWAEGNPGVTVRGDDAVTAAELADADAVWLLGWENRHLDAFRTRLGGAARVNNDGVRLRGKALARDGHSVVLTTADDSGTPWGWLAADPAAALPGLARKLPHYGKYSYLAFAGAEPGIARKGQWPVTDSPMNRALAEDAPALDLPPRPPLTRTLEGGE